MATLNVSIILIQLHAKMSSCSTILIFSRVSKSLFIRTVICNRGLLTFVTFRNLTNSAFNPQVREQLFFNVIARSRRMSKRILSCSEIFNIRLSKE